MKILRHSLKSPCHILPLLLKLPFSRGKFWSRSGTQVSNKADSGLFGIFSKILFSLLKDKKKKKGNPRLWLWHLGLFHIYISTYKIIRLQGSVQWNIKLCVDIHFHLNPRIIGKIKKLGRNNLIMSLSLYTVNSWSISNYNLQEEEIERPRLYCACLVFVVWQCGGAVERKSCKLSPCIYF